MIFDPTVDLSDQILCAMYTVYKVYRSADIEHVALQGISLRLYKGEIVGCIGPSGSGKTTLLQILAGLIPPTAGTIYWGPLKANIAQFSPDELARVRNKFMGYVSQIPHLLPHLSVLKNVMYAGLIHGANRRTTKQSALDLLERVKLINKSKTSPHKLSSGELQRVALACALINKPQIVLADEPTGNLDFETGEVFLDLIEELNQTLGTAFFIVTHSPQVARRLPKIYELKDGILIGQHTVANLAAPDQTRMLTPDDQNRLYIPKELLEALGSPVGFSTSINQDGLLLKPVTNEKTRATFINKEQSLTCQLCNTNNSLNQRFCTKCGSFLSQYHLFSEGLHKKTGLD